MHKVRGWPSKYPRDRRCKGPEVGAVLGIIKGQVDEQGGRGSKRRGEWREMAVKGSWGWRQLLQGLVGQRVCI